LGIGDWGLGIGDWAQSPIPNPHPHFEIINNIFILIIYLFKLKKNYFIIKNGEQF
jgi:hypothetical protein